MAIQVQQLSDDVCVAPQLGPEAIAALAQAGFKSVINNRPDFDGGPNQPTNSSIEAAAKAAGQAYAFLPVAPNYRSPEEVARFAELMAALPKPILAFCRSGARSGKQFRAATGA